MIRNDEQLYAQLHLETRLSSARKNALYMRICQEAAARSTQKPVSRWEWDFFRMAAGAACIAAVGFSAHMLYRQLPLAENGSSIESLLEEASADTGQTTERLAETTTSHTDAQSAATEPDSASELHTEPTHSHTQETTTVTSAAATGSSATGAASQPSVTTAESHTTAESSATAVSEEVPSPAPEQKNTFSIESVTCGADETVTLRLTASKEAVIAGMVLYIDILDETTDCTPPAYVSMTPVWLADEGSKYSWNPATLSLAPSTSLSSAIPRGACLLELTVQIPENIPSGTVYNVYMSQYESAQNGGKLIGEPYILGTVTVQ